MKRIPTLLVAAAIGINTQAQPGLNSANNTPGVGSTYVYHHTSWTDPGPASADTIWDYSTLAAGSDLTLNFVDPTATTNASFFTSTGATVASDDAAGHTYYYKTSLTAWEQVGDDTATIQIPLTDGAVLLPFPCTYGTTWSDPFFGNYTTPLGPSTRTGVITGDGDAWGTLAMPGYIADNVLRVHTVDSVHDATPIFTIVNIIDRYTYYKTWLPVPLMVIQHKEISINGGTPVVTQQADWYDGENVGIALNEGNAFGAHMYPNPASDEVTITFGTERSSAMTMEVIDGLGRTVRNEQLGTLALGFQRHTLDARGLGAGLYTVRLHDGSGNSSSLRLVVK